VSENRSHRGDGLSATGFYYNRNISPVKDEYYSEISITNEISLINKKAMATPSPLTCVSSLSNNVQILGTAFPIFTHSHGEKPTRPDRERFITPEAIPA
jgi:hypothetical protein